MKKTSLLFILIILIVTSLALTACATEPVVALGGDKSQIAQTEGITDQGVEPVEAASSIEDTGQVIPNLDKWVEEVPRLDEQGEVTVLITPLNLNQAWESIDFQVKMNTHSVDLSMDLTELVTLTTDAGHTIQAISWDAPSGGHHISGKLSFPASVNNIPLLDGVSQITLSLVGVDAELRNFSWER